MKKADSIPQAETVADSSTKVDNIEEVSHSENTLVAGSPFLSKEMCQQYMDSQTNNNSLSEIFKNAPKKNGWPVVSTQQILDTLKGNGFKNAFTNDGL